MSVTCPSSTAALSSDVITVYPESTLEEVIDLMIEYRIGAVPVVEVDSSRVIGIVSYIDVLRAARSALS
jgi:acetoin utilization protein AcuB